MIQVTSGASYCIQTGATTIGGPRWHGTEHDTCRTLRPPLSPLQLPWHQQVLFPLQQLPGYTCHAAHCFSTPHKSQQHSLRMAPTQPRTTPCAHEGGGGAEVDGSTSSTHRIKHPLMELAGAVALWSHTIMHNKPNAHTDTCYAKHLQATPFTDMHPSRGLCTGKSQLFFLGLGLCTL